MINLRYIPVFILLFLAGCAVRGAETPAQRLYAAQAEFNTYLHVAASYVQQPECSAAVQVACAEPRIKEHIKSLAREAKSLLDAARSALAGSRESPAIEAASAAVRSLVTYLVQREIVHGA